MSEYSAWFGEELVLEWFLLCDFYTSQFIQRAVMADSVRVFLSFICLTIFPLLIYEIEYMRSSEGNHNQQMYVETVLYLIF